MDKQRLAQIKAELENKPRTKYNSIGLLTNKDLVEVVNYALELERKLEELTGNKAIITVSDADIERIKEDKCPECGQSVEEYFNGNKEVTLICEKCGWELLRWKDSKLRRLRSEN
jgi:predicted RNA-binding Zn-ribbon protein involved in translation (DUF1610 family)